MDAKKISDDNLKANFEKTKSFSKFILPSDSTKDFDSIPVENQTSNINDTDLAVSDNIINYELFPPPPIDSITGTSFVL